MNTLPHTPVTFTTRQLTCVSCQERFAVAEDLIMANQAPGWNGHLPTQAATTPSGIVANFPLNRSANGPSGKWRLPNDKTEAIALREQEISFQRSVTPQKRAEPLATPFHAYSYEQSDDTYLNCPRCGADNRNWAQLMAQPASLQTWLRRFPLAGWSLVVAGLVTIAAGAAGWTLRISSLHSVLLLLAIIMTSLFISRWLTRQWRRLHQARNLAMVRPNGRFHYETALWLKGLAIVFACAIILPLTFFEVAPRIFDYTLTRLGDPPPAAEEAVPESPQYEVRIPFVVPYDDPFYYWLQFQLLLRHPWLADFYIEVQAESVQADPEPAEPRPFLTFLGAGRRYLAMWAATVGLTTLLTITASLTAAGRFAARTDEHLPSPIFNSVAHMSRVVMWEAKRALKINGDLSQIQWMRVERNSQGGIDLIGLHRERPEVENGRFSATVRAQRYTIHSDIWGRIVHTEVRDVTVPRSIIQQTGVEINAYQQEYQPDGGVFNPLFVGHQS